MYYRRHIFLAQNMATFFYSLYHLGINFGQMMDFRKKKTRVTAIRELF